MLREIVGWSVEKDWGEVWRLDSKGQRVRDGQRGGNEGLGTDRG